jgi:CRP/FNR family transcriptional regulator
MVGENFFDEILSREERSEFLSLGRRQLLDKSTLMFEFGEIHKGFYLLLDGYVKIYRVDEQGKEAILQIRGPGDLIAAVPLLTGENTYPGSAETLTDSIVYYYDNEYFHHYLKDNPEIKTRFSSYLNRLTQYFREKSVSLMLKSVPERLYDFLQELGAHKDFIRLPIPKNQIALLIGATAETVSRSLKSMKDEGLLEEDDGRYKLIVKQS